MRQQFKKGFKNGLKTGIKIGYVIGFVLIVGYFCASGIPALSDLANILGMRN